MAITRPTTFYALERTGLAAFQREQKLGLKEEWVHLLDDTQHLYAYLSRSCILSFAGTASTSAAGVQHFHPLKWASTSAVDRLVVPYALPERRYGQTSSALTYEIEHTGGTIIMTAENAARSVTYDTDTDTRTTRGTFTGTLDISSSGEVGVVVLSMDWDGVTGSAHLLHRAVVQQVEVALADM